MRDTADIEHQLAVVTNVVSCAKARTVPTAESAGRMPVGMMPGRR